MNLFEILKPKPLTRQIRMYVAWKGTRYPLVARSHEAILSEFMKYARIHCVTQITYENILAYVDTQNSTFFRRKSLETLRQFVRYWEDMGLLNLELSSVVKTDTIPFMMTGRPPDVDMIQRVKRLRATLVDDKPMSFRQIKLTLETEDRKAYDIKSIYRWAKYDPERLSTHLKRAAC